jgi:hypothetical protein
LLKAFVLSLFETISTHPKDIIFKFVSNRIGYVSLMYIICAQLR